MGKKVHIKNKDKKNIEAEFIEDQKNEIVLAKTILRSDKLVMTRSEFINSILDGIEEIEIPESRRMNFIRELTTQAMQKVKLVKDSDIGFVGETTIKVYIIASRDDYEKHQKRKDNPAFWRKILALDFDSRRLNNDRSKAIFEIKLNAMATIEVEDKFISEIEEMLDYFDKHKKEAKIMVNSYQLGGLDAFRKYLNTTDEWIAKEDMDKVEIKENKKE